jgi:hypothetical protein
MTIIAKAPIEDGNVTIPKGTKGSCKAVSNDVRIKATFTGIKHKPDSWFYICSFPGLIEETLCDLTQIEIQA